MKWCFALFTFGLVVVAIAEKATTKDYAKDYSKYYEKYVKKDEGKKESTKEGRQKNNAKDYEKYYEKYWKPEGDGAKEGTTEGAQKDYVKEYEKYWKKDWSKENGNSDPEDTNDYLDDLYHSLRTDAKSLNLDSIDLPETSFKVRLQSQGKRVIIPVTISNQVLTGLQTVKRVGDGQVQKYYGDPKLGSVFKAKDLEIHGVVSISNKSCSLFVDIEELTGRVELALRENKSEPLTVASLRIFPLANSTVEIQEGCIEDEEVREGIISKYWENLKEDLASIIRKPFKAALNKNLKPFETKK